MRSELDTGSVLSLTYDINDDAFLVFSEDETSFKKYNWSGTVISEVTTGVALTHHQPICLTDGIVIYRKEKKYFGTVKQKRRGKRFLKF